ncbi:MAG: dihydrofolate reductase [Acidobacteria bacterium]|nr:dihydrofolate reductase [Acidobacteriota bacterium]
MVSLIVAMDKNRGIGIDNRLPWRLSADLKRFRELTMGHHIIVGRKTFESIGKPLPGRQTIIVTRNETYQAANASTQLSQSCFIVHSVEEAIALARSRGESEVFVCGGAEIYAQVLGFADRLYLTLVETEVDADTFFPEWDESEWVEKESFQHSADEKNQFPFTFKVLERKIAYPMKW